jgi:hypothetical protein
VELSGIGVDPAMRYAKTAGPRVDLDQAPTGKSGRTTRELLTAERLPT